MGKRNKRERERERSVARGRRKYRELSSASARERGGRKNEKKRGDEIIKDQEEGGVSVERGEKEEREREKDRSRGVARRGRQEGASGEDDGRKQTNGENSCKRML